MSENIILVTGATGQQGGAVVKALIEKGSKVRALTRDPNSEKAKALAAAGVEVVKGEFDHPDSISAAAKGVSVAWLVSTPFDPSVGAEGESRQAIAAIDALKAGGVGHIVYSSVSDADKNTGIPHFESKYKVEQYLKASGVAYTITAPVYFSDNLIGPFGIEQTKNATVAIAMPPERKLQVISVRDIGRLNAAVLTNATVFSGRRINIAGDELSGREQAEALTAASGKPFSFFEVPLEAVRSMSEDFALMYEWFDKVGYSADIKALKQEFPEVNFQSFEEWAREQDWKQLLAV